MSGNVISTRIMDLLVVKNYLLVRWLGPIVAIAASLVLGALSARMQIISILLIGLVFGTFGAILLIRYHGLGFPLIAISSLVIPFSIGTGTQTSINSSFLLVIALIGLWVLEMITVEKKLAIVSSRPLLPLFLFVLSAVISFGYGQLHWFPVKGASINAQLGGLGIFVFSAGAFFLAAHRMEVRWLKWMIWIFLALSFIYMIGSLIPYFPIRRMLFRVFQRAVMDSLFWTWFTAMAFSQMLINKRLPIWIRLMLGAMTLISLYITVDIKQAWTSGWLPSLLSVGVILFLVHPRVALAGGAALGVLLLIRSTLASDILMAGDNSYSLMTRLEAWKILFQIIGKSPIFGVGPSNYYFYTPFFNILGYNVSFNSHNNYIDLLAQTGIAGLGFFLWFAIEIGMVSWNLHDKVPEGFVKAFVYGAIGGLVGTLVAGMLGDWILPFVYNIGMEGFRASVFAWLFLGSLVMIEQKLKNSPASLAED